MAFELLGQIARLFFLLPRRCWGLRFVNSTFLEQPRDELERHGRGRLAVRSLPQIAVSISSLHVSNNELQDLQILLRLSQQLSWHVQLVLSREKGLKNVLLEPLRSLWHPLSELRLVLLNDNLQLAHHHVQNVLHFKLLRNEKL